jgi:hypothetical protein
VIDNNITENGRSGLTLHICCKSGIQSDLPVGVRLLEPNSATPVMEIVADHSGTTLSSLRRKMTNKKPYIRLPLILILMLLIRLSVDGKALSASDASP